jgi:DNA-binding FrmR family transcriptional regulator
MNRENKSKLLHRLNRAAGQVSGITRMVEEDRYCIDILIQLRSVRAALAKVENELLRDHIGHCVKHAMTSGDQAEQNAKADELIQLLTTAAR